MYGSMFVYPSEYNVFGHSSVPQIKWKWAEDENNITKWQRDYRLTDHLGSVVAEIRVDAEPDKVQDFNFFLAFGMTPISEIGSFPNGWIPDAFFRNSRLTYIGKEVDKENMHGDFGVRKYNSISQTIAAQAPLVVTKYYPYFDIFLSSSS